MKILVATFEDQGTHAGDFHYCRPGEPVTGHPSELRRETFVSAATDADATTTAMVMECGFAPDLGVTYTPGIEAALRELEPGVVVGRQGDGLYVRLFNHADCTDDDHTTDLDSDDGITSDCWQCGQPLFFCYKSGAHQHVDPEQDQRCILLLPFHRAADGAPAELLPCGDPLTDSLFELRAGASALITHPKFQDVNFEWVVKPAIVWCTRHGWTEIDSDERYEFLRDYRA